MLYVQVNFHHFIDSFKKADRDIFSYEGYKALFNYLDEQDEQLEFCAVDLACTYSELAYDEIKQDYCLDEDATEEDIIDYLNEHTFVVHIGPGSVLFEEF